MDLKENMDYLTGIADYFKYENKPPRWMNAEEKKEWRKGWEYAAIQTVGNTST